MRYLFTFLIALVLSAPMLHANRPSRVQATKEPIAYTLPNGDTLMIRLHGDERRHWRTTLDGWVIEEKSNGYYYYQTQKKDKEGRAIVSHRRAHNEDARCRCEKKWLKKHGVNYFIYE